jgi:Ca-activated chloride channel family protein
MKTLLTLCLAFLPLQAQACKVALMLGIDVSHSIDFTEYRWQVDGLSAALNDPVIASTLVDLDAAVAVTQWSGEDQQEVSIPWVRMTSEDSLRAFQHRVDTLKRPWDNSNTAVGAALTTMIGEFSKVPDCSRQVIDFSGDGDNNSGEVPREAREMARQLGIMVNGLAIDRLGLSITKYYRDFVIVGRGAFVVTAHGYHDYARAIRKKLFRELLPPSS